MAYNFLQDFIMKAVNHKCLKCVGYEPFLTELCIQVTDTDQYCFLLVHTYLYLVDKSSKTSMIIPKSVVCYRFSGCGCQTTTVPLEHAARECIHVLLSQCKILLGPWHPCG